METETLEHVAVFALVISIVAFFLGLFAISKLPSSRQITPADRKQ